MKRLAVSLAALLLPASALAQAAFALPHPNRPPRMVIPWLPGQATGLKIKLE